MLFRLVPFVPKEPCSRSGDPDIALQSNVPRCLFSPTSNEMPNSQLCPDITGGAFFYGVEAIEDTYGAFGANMSKTHNYAGHTIGDKSWPELRLYASNSNGIYGRSSSVSVAAAYVLMIIKA